MLANRYTRQRSMIFDFDATIPPSNVEFCLSHRRKRLKPDPYNRWTPGYPLTVAICTCVFVWTCKFVIDSGRRVMSERRQREIEEQG